MCNQVVLHDFLPESEYVWIIGIDRRTNPMGVGMTKGRHSCEVLNDPATRRSDQGLVNAEDVRIPVHVDHGLAERERTLRIWCLPVVIIGCSRSIPPKPAATALNTHPGGKIPKKRLSFGEE
jgi:hypothetical protein